MTDLLFIVGIAVFFLTVYGVVMVGGYLLKAQSTEYGPRPGAPVRVPVASGTSPRREMIGADR